MIALPLPPLPLQGLEYCNRFLGSGQITLRPCFHMQSNKVHLQLLPLFPKSRFPISQFDSQVLRLPPLPGTEGSNCRRNGTTLAPAPLLLSCPILTTQSAVRQTIKPTVSLHSCNLTSLNRLEFLSSNFQFLTSKFQLLKCVFVVV